MNRFNLDQPLVFDGVGFEKEAATELPPDESRWIIEIEKEVQEKIPSISSVDYKIDLKKTQNDKGQGYGYGAVVGKNYVIPIIIKNGELQDFDVFLDKDGIAWPISHGYFEEYMATHNTDSIGKVVKKKKGQDMPLNLLDRMQAPSMPRYSRTGPMQERATLASDRTLLNNIHKTKEEISKIAKYLKDNPEVVTTYKQNGNDHMLKLAMTPDEPVEAKSNDNDQEDAFEIKLGKTAEQITQDGVYIVKGADGKYYKGNVITNVVGFDMQPKDYMVATKLKAADDSRLKYSIQSSMAGVRVGDLPDKITECMSHGDSMKCFVYEGENKYFVFEPVKVLSRKTYAEERKVTITSDTNYDERSEVTKHGRSYEFLVQDMMGVQFKIFVGENYEGVSIVDGSVYMNSKFEIRGLGEADVQLIQNPVVINEHIKSKVSAPPATVKLAGDTLSINEEWASDNLREGTHVKFAREELKKYYTEKSIDNIIKIASEKGTIKINRPSFRREKVVVYENVPSCDTIKEAAVMPDNDTVDKVLSINFLNPGNVSKFVTYIPELNKCLNKLADLLLASRMGLDIPPIAVKVAMDNLAKTLMYLKSVEKGENQYESESN